MRTLEYLADPTLRAIYAPGLIAGLATALLCGIVSPLVVVKRMGFIGQGISHAAFGGVGVAALLAAWGVCGSGGLAEFAVILTFCMLAALGMAALADPAASSGAPRRTAPATSEDTAIGVYLVGSMALGAVLVQVARDHAIGAGHPADARPWESILFGSVLLAGPGEAVLAWIALAVVAAALWLARRPLLLWAVDDQAARVMGAPASLTRAGFTVLLAVVVVSAMKVAGVVLASALLVLPGAAALRLADRLGAVLAVSCMLSLGAAIGGLVVALETNWPPGPCVVGAALVAFIVASVLPQAVRTRRPTAEAVGFRLT